MVDMPEEVDEEEGEFMSEVPDTKTSRCSDLWLLWLGESLRSPGMTLGEDWLGKITLRGRNLSESLCRSYLTILKKIVSKC